MPVRTAPTGACRGACRRSSAARHAAARGSPIRRWFLSIPVGSCTTPPPERRGAITSVDSISATGLKARRRVSTLQTLAQSGAEHILPFPARGDGAASGPCRARGREVASHRKSPEVIGSHRRRQARRVSAGRGLTLSPPAPDAASGLTYVFSKTDSSPRRSAACRATVAVTQSATARTRGARRRSRRMASQISRTTRSSGRMRRSDGSASAR
jgi:hypothetical protein